MKTAMMVLAQQKLQVEEKMVTIEDELNGLYEAGVEAESVAVTERELQDVMIQMNTIEDSLFLLAGNDSALVQEVMAEAIAK